MLVLDDTSKIFCIYSVPILMVYQMVFFTDAFVVMKRGGYCLR